MPGVSSATDPTATPDSARLVVLGAGSILPRDGFGCSGYALQGVGRDLTLLDCGPGSLRALGSAGFGVEDVRRVFVSHFHPDHCLDLLALAFARRNPRLADAPELELVGPVGLADWVERAGQALGRWVVDPGTAVTEVALDGEGRGSLERDGARWTCAGTGHTPEALAWRVDAGFGSLTYSGDSGPCEALVELARCTDWFLCECSFRDEEATPHHLTPRTAAEHAALAGSRRLLLTHFYPGLAPDEAAATAARTYAGTVLTARDGARFDL